MGIKAKLTVRLLAGDVLVAESDDEKLWRSVLGSIQGVATADQTEGPQTVTEDAGGTDDAVARLSGELGLRAPQVRGACDPSVDEPYIHLDRRSWETFKKNTPARGPNAVAGVNLAGTLLCLWFKTLGKKDKPAQAQALAVLDTIGVQDRNPSRALQNCDWLQSRGGTIQINAARYSKALAVAKAYCSGEPVEVG